MSTATGKPGTEDVFATSWELTAQVRIGAPATEVYRMVSDITRMGEWSPECFGGRWVEGTPGRAGARFHGFNREGQAVWTSESQVVAADEGREFGFTVLRFCAGEPGPDSDWLGGSQPGDMTWSFHLEDDGPDACVLTQRHVMRLVGPFYRALLQGVPESERPAHVSNRKQHLQHSMEATLSRVKDVAERHG
ncbi:MULTISPECIES: SRPBCC family protein [Streptomyces]|uniref:SRPBCC family protein n=1 Tax=Streptomyces TaxID=1883 RepID=UPI0006904E54|nr:SRPBCC family protein [Streptomyces sp. NRRL F-5639]